MQIILFLVVQSTVVFREPQLSSGDTRLEIANSTHLLLLLKFKITGEPGEAAKFQEIIKLSKILNWI